MSRRLPSAVAILGLVALLATVGIRLGVQMLLPNQGGVDLYLVPAGLLALGYMVLRKVPNNWVGWVLELSGLVVAISAFLEMVWVRYGFDQIGSDHSITLVAWLAAALGQLPWWAVLVWIPLFFPTGRILSPGWRWAAGAALGSQLSLVVINLFHEDLCVAWPADGPDCLISIDNPLGIPGVADPNGFATSVVAILAAVAVTTIVALISLYFRYRLSHGVERQQVRYVALAALTLGLVLMPAVFADIVLELPVPELFFQLAFLTLPAAIALSIVKYRLYDIDRLVSRTVTYLVVIVAVALVFAVGTVGLSSLFDLNDTLSVAATTLAAAALFNPVRRRVQRSVEHRFNRSRYDAERVMEEFARSLRDQVDPDGLVDGWVEVVDETMQPSGVGVWVRR